jgi:hypothetical protein
VGASKIANQVTPQGNSNPSPVVKKPMPSPLQNVPQPDAQLSVSSAEILPIRYGALPGLNVLNNIVDTLKETLRKQKTGRHVTTGAYLGFRIITYSCLPLIFNLISLLVSALLTLIALPIALCDNRLLNWSWNYLKGSAQCTMGSLWDLTYDLRQLTGRCCCDPESLYLSI